MNVLITKSNNPLFALQCVLKALGWLNKPSLRKFLLMPILINFILYGAAFVLGYLFLPTLVAQFIPDKLHWLSWLIKPLFFVCFIIAGIFSFTLLANLIASPFYGNLSAQTLELLIQEKQSDQSNEDQEAEDDSNFTAPSWQHIMLAELRRLGYLFKWLLVLLIISLIPILNLISPLFWGVFGAWSCALEFFAYPLENKGLLFPAQKAAVSKVRFGALSFGTITLVGLGIPVLNLLVAPMAVIAATFYVYQIDEELKLQNTQ